MAVAAWIGHNRCCHSIITTCIGGRHTSHRGISILVTATNAELGVTVRVPNNRNNETATTGWRVRASLSRQHRYCYWNRGSRMMASSSAARYYDSHGDYQADDESGYFLRHNNSSTSTSSTSRNSLPLFQHQDSLPLFPVPKLADTIERLKPSCLPLASTDEERDRFLVACDRFQEQARELQRLLEDRAQNEEKNWLQRWWNQVGYLQFRGPSPINVNYFFQLPKVHRYRRNGNGNGNAGQLERGARVLHSAASYSRMVLDGSLPQEVIGKKERATPLCSSMYKYLFHSCRIPKPNQDVYRIYQHQHQHQQRSSETEPLNSFPNHAVVSARGHYFSVDLIEPSTRRPYSVAELELALEECAKHAASLVNQHGAAAAAAAEVVRNLGILTTAHRDEWATNRARLLDSVPGMDTALETLESGLLLLCLDGSSNSDDDHSNKPSAHAHVDSLSQNARSYLMGTQGRWYDKSLQFIVTPSGDLGLNGEHSMMDGMPAVGLCQYILRNEATTDDTDTDTETKNETETEALSERSLPRVEPIFANDTILLADANTNTNTNATMNPALDATKSMIDKASADFNKLRGSLDLEVQSFRGYGATWIKTHARCSPDACVQMAIQLAVGKLALHVRADSDEISSRVHVLPWATYESTQVRSYCYGRTETTRSVSPQSSEWVDSMLLHESESKSRRDLFHKATDAHVDYIRKASKGGGVDRHLFGLQMILAEQQQQQQTQEVDLFGDPLFVRSKAWKVSTSTLPVNPGFGPVVVPDGVGIAYDVQDDHIYFTCTSYKALAPALSHFLEEALVEIKEMILESEGGKKVRSKL